MPENARITFYKINSCGYYRRGRNNPMFGALPDTLAALLGWVAPGVKPLDHTSTYAPSEDEESEVLRVFCAGMHRNRGDFVLSTWNEISNQDGAIASIDVSNPVGAAVPTLTAPDRNMVPGYPAYFWFLPDRNMVANIRFDSERLSGTRGMQLYLQSYLNYLSPHVVMGLPTEDADHNVVGYTAAPGGPVLQLSPRFQSIQMHRPQHIANLRGRRQFIRKVIRKAVLAPATAVEARGLAAFFQMIGLVDQPAQGAPIRVRSELALTPTPEQFDQMVANWQERRTEEWEDVGLIFQGDAKIEWLSAGAGRFDVELDVARGDQGFVTAPDLLAALSARKARLLGLIEE